jgi:hypothetical protein
MRRTLDPCLLFPDLSADFCCSQFRGRLERGLLLSDHNCQPGDIKLQAEPLLVCPMSDGTILALDGALQNQIGEILPLRSESNDQGHLNEVSFQFTAPDVVFFCK